MSVTANPSLAHWIAGARPRTLPAAVVPVAVGAGSAAGLGDGIVWWRVVAALAVALALQIGVNYANDYSDGVRGTDDARVGPVRLVASGLAAPRAVKRAALAAFLLAALVGLALAAATTWWLVLIGVAAIGSAWGYTGGPRPYGYLGLGELFVFVFFGLVATVGTTYVAVETVPAVAWVAGCGVGFLACALLVVNNLRDIATDERAGKLTLAVRLGDRRTRRLYATLVVAGFLAAALAGGWRPWALIAVAGLGLARDPIRRVLEGATGPELIAVLVETGKVQLLYGGLLTIGLALGA